MQDVIIIVKCQFQINDNESLWEAIPKKKLTKFGRCGSSTIECLNNRTARLLGLFAETAGTARISALIET